MLDTKFQEEKHYNRKLQSGYTFCKEQIKDNL